MNYIIYNGIRHTPEGWAKLNSPDAQRIRRNMAQRLRYQQKQRALGKPVRKHSRIWKDAKRKYYSLPPELIERIKATAQAQNLGESDSVTYGLMAWCNAQESGREPLMQF